ncbi:hypothetical protein HDU96_010068 [Phlyctochytrium bullatum]|nr:hypothetical protein HDU96_010068 [Phlyctochytrium bullatum]
MVLITNKQSNILQDIDTLHLFARVVSEYCRSTDERDITKQSFELLNVFDEIVALGYRESVNLPQIRTITEMESHEERIQAEIEKNREKEAKDELNRKAKIVNRPAPSGKGMQLGKKPKTEALFEAIKSEEGIDTSRDRKGGLGLSSPHPQSARDSIHITAEEKVNLKINRDGALEAMEVKGLLSLCMKEPRPGIQLKLKPVSNESASFNVKFYFELPNGSIQTHPKVDKDLFANSVIGLRDPNGIFPVDQPVTVLRWRIASKDENAIPLASMSFLYA